jgi:hypothetical protein
MVLKRIDMTTMNDDERIAAMKEVLVLLFQCSLFVQLFKLNLLF